MNGARKTDIDSTVLVGLAVCIVALVVAAFAERILFREGSELFLDLLRFWKLKPHNPGLYRYSDILLQIPSATIIAISNGEGGLWYWLSHVVGGLMFYLNPFVSLWITFRILRFEKLRSLWIYPVIAFALGTMPSLAFGVNNITLGVSAFWLALALVIRGEFRFWHAFGYVMAVILMTLEHESMILLSFCLIGATLILRPKHPLFFLIPAVLSSMWFLLLLSRPDLMFPPQIQKHMSGLLPVAIREILDHSGIHRFYVISAAAIIVLLVQPLFRSKLEAWKDKLSIAILIGGMLFVCWISFATFNMGQPLRYSFFYRIVVTPIVALFAGLMVIQKKYNYEITLSRKFQIAISSLLVVSAIQDARATVSWFGFTREVRSRLNKMEGRCLAVSEETTPKSFFGYGIHIIPTSLVLQNSNRPKKIIGIHFPSNGLYQNFCDDIREGIYSYVYASELHDTKFIKFDLLRD